MKTTTLLFLFLSTAASAALAQISPELQITLAVQAAPETERAAATVHGYDGDGTFTTLREGSNELICIAPNPESDRFEVSCHHLGLEPFFARGRELLANGVEGEERTKTRWSEIAAGTLSLPSGTTNTIVTGSGFDPDTGAIAESSTRWVIYMPGATAGSTGLPERPMGPGSPWLMFSGTQGAHIMITPATGN
jgi:hypothetical protein